MTEAVVIGQIRNVRSASARLRSPPDSQGPVSWDLDSVYREHADFVYRCLRRFGVEDSSIEDRVHDVFLVVQRRLSEFDGRAAMTSWLYGIARGVAANDRRGRRRADRHFLALLREEEGTMASRQSMPDAELADRQALAALEQFTGTLAAGHREAFVLVELEGMTPRDAARALKVDVARMHALLKTARRRFVAFVAAMEGMKP